MGNRVFQRKSKEGVKGETWYVDYRDPAGRRIIRAIGPAQRRERLRITWERSIPASVNAKP